MTDEFCADDHGKDKAEEINSVRRNEAQGQCTFREVASLRPLSEEASDAISAIDFCPGSSLFATAGIAKKIRLYELVETECETVFDDDDAVEGNEKKRKLVTEADMRMVKKVAEIYAPAKLSSVAWHPRDRGLICCGDYDGVVTEWDAERGVAVDERYDHGGRRVWSVDYARFDQPALCASAGGDGTIRLWSAGAGNACAGVIRPSSTGASVCSVQFSPFTPNLLAGAAADGGFHLYDTRRPDARLSGARGHARAVSYVRFLDKGRLVSASIDNTTKVWDILCGPQPRLLRTWEGQHLNVKNFVGLSALNKRGGLIACGSETNELVIYHSEEARSLWRCQFHPVKGRNRVFVGAVCWKPREESDDVQSVVAANSEGSLQVIESRLLA
uniref:Uncharacterized protein n=1 Tax=Araucaria cunninghamii TaxID=56994 RepID=A0A0D6R8R7_ARACU